MNRVVEVSEDEAHGLYTHELIQLLRDRGIDPDRPYSAVRHPRRGYVVRQERTDEFVKGVNFT